MQLLLLLYLIAIAGLTFRPSTDGAAVCLLGTKINQFSLFYSYDLSFSNFQRYNGGSHELSVAYTIATKVKPTTTTPAGN